MFRLRRPRRRTVIVLGCFLAPPAVLTVVGARHTKREFKEFRRLRAIEEAARAARGMFLVPVIFTATRIPLGVPKGAGQ